MKDYYISELIKCGYTTADANRVYHMFLKDHNITEFVPFIESLKKTGVKKCG